MDMLSSNEIPMGVGMALAENMEAMYAFSQLDDSRREEFIKSSKNISSREEMQSYVNSLLNM